MKSLNFEQVAGRDSLIENSTAEVAKKLAESGFVFPGVNYAKNIDSELDVDDQKYEGQVYWLDFITPENKSKSGKLFIPKESNSKLVAIYGGLPGDDIVKKERLFASALLKGKYMVWVSRHNGTRLNDQNTELFIGSPDIARECANLGMNHIGEKPSGDFLEEFALEPDMDLSVFNANENIKEIILVGHSYGAASIVYSVKTDREDNGGKKSGKVKKIISINGYLGLGEYPDDNNSIIPGTYITPQQVLDSQIKASKKYFDIPENPEVTLAMNKIMKKNNEGMIPLDVQMIVLASPTDAYMPPEASKNLYDRSHSGLFIHDLTHSEAGPRQLNENKVFAPEFAPATPEEIKQANAEARAMYGGSQHSSPNWGDGATLLRLVEMSVENKKHEVVFRGQEQK